MFKKLKYLVRDDRLYQAIFVILLLLAAFFLGRVSVQVAVEGARSEVGVQLLQGTDASEPYTTTLASTTQTSVYASVNGERYYAMDCGAGTRIDMENRLYFSTVDQALAAGYTPSEQCMFP